MKEPGETVKANDTLATVESNDSLQVYPVKSPVAGLVINRNASVGEVAGETPLFVVADVSKLWAELFVFSRDGEKIKAGQKVHIQCLDDDLITQADISVVLPTTEASSQTFVARAVIDNPDNHWRSSVGVLFFLTMGMLIDIAMPMFATFGMIRLGFILMAMCICIAFAVLGAFCVTRIAHGIITATSQS